MTRIINFMTIAILGFISIDANSQILVKNVYNNKQIEINTNDRIKLVFETDKKFNGFYDFVVHGKNKDFKTGKLKLFNDNIIVVQSGLFSKMDTIQINNIHTINRFNPYVRAGITIVTSAGLVLVLTSTSIVDSPLILGYALAGIWGITLADDLIVYPHKNIKREKWIIEVK